MDRRWYLIGLLGLIMCSMLIPAYAEVSSIKVNRTFFGPGSTIYFTGTVDAGDAGKIVNLAIHDPTGKFISPLQSAFTSTNGTFQVTITTNQQYSVKGSYNATAFIAQESAGKVVSFIFSPDGSPIAPAAPTSLISNSKSSSEIDLSWVAPAINGGAIISGYQIERNDGTGFNVIHNAQSTTYQDIGLIPNKQYSYRVSAVNSAGQSNPSIVVNATTLSAPIQPTQNNVPSPGSTPNQGPNQTLTDILKQRLENARKLQELLNAQNPKYSSVELAESLGSSDVISNTGPQKGTIEKENNPANNLTNSFDFKNIIYPVISAVGAGIVGFVIYLRKRRISNAKDLESDKKSDYHADELVSKMSESEGHDDYAMMILRNRLVKGDITVEEFKSLKDALTEP